MIPERRPEQQKPLQQPALSKGGIALPDFPKFSNFHRSDLIAEGVDFSRKETENLRRTFVGKEYQGGLDGIKGTGDKMGGTITEAPKLEGAADYVTYYHELGVPADVSFSIYLRDRQKRFK